MGMWGKWVQGSKNPAEPGTEWGNKNPEIKQKQKYLVEQSKNISPVAITLSVYYQIAIIAVAGPNVAISIPYCYIEYSLCKHCKIFFSKS